MAKLKITAIVDGEAYEGFITSEMFANAKDASSKYQSLLLDHDKIVHNFQFDDGRCIVIAPEMAKKTIVIYEDCQT